MMSKKSIDIAIEKVSDVNDYFCDQYDFVKKLSTVTSGNPGIHCFQGISFDGSLHFIKKCSKFYVQRSNIDNPWNEINALHILSLIQSNHFPAFIKAIEDDQYICLISEYIDGMDLCETIQQNKGGLEPIKAQKYLIQISHAIRELHDHNLAHMDISPENVIIDTNDNIKVIDFGVCTSIRDESKCEEKSTPHYSESDTEIDENKTQCTDTYHKHISSCTLPGKDGYRAPEIETRKACDPRLADAFSFGYMAWAVLCGNMPFESANPKNEVYEKFMRHGAGEWSRMLRESMNAWEDTKNTYCVHEIPANAIRMLDGMLECNTFKRTSIEALLDDDTSFLSDKIEEKKNEEKTRESDEYKMNHSRNRVQIKSSAQDTDPPLFTFNMRCSH